MKLIFSHFSKLTRSVKAGHLIEVPSAKLSMNCKLVLVSFAFAWRMAIM